MKKSRMQVLIEFSALLSQLRSKGKSITKKVSSGSKRGKAALLILFLLSVTSSSFAARYYSRTNGGNWTATTTWSTVTYGNVTNTGTYPQAGDLVYIGDGYTVYINNNVNCATINIGQGSSGILEYASAANYSLNVSGSVTVNTGATFWYNTAVNRSHTCTIGGNFTNFGAVDFYRSAAQAVNLMFNAATNATVSGIGSWDLYVVTLNKSASTAQVTVQTNGFELGIKNFVGTMGTYVHSNTGVYAINASLGNYTIGPDMVFRVPAGIMWFSALSTDLVLQGALYVNELPTLSVT